MLPHGGGKQLDICRWTSVESLYRAADFSGAQFPNFPVWPIDRLALIYYTSHVPTGLSGEL